MKLEDAFNLLAEPFAYYAFYKQDEDTRSPAGQKMNGQVSNLLVQIGEATAFAVPEILEISDADMDRFYQEAPELEHYRLALTRIRRQKAHTLSKEQEALLASAQKLGQSPSNIYNFLNDADLPFPDAVDQDGNRHPLSSPWSSPPTARCASPRLRISTAPSASSATPSPPRWKRR